MVKEKYQIVNYSMKEFVKYVSRRAIKTLLFEYDANCGKCPAMWYI